jgi:hypothetical protein
MKRSAKPPNLARALCLQLIVVVSVVSVALLGLYVVHQTAITERVAPPHATRPLSAPPETDSNTNTCADANEAIGADLQ